MADFEFKITSGPYAGSYAVDRSDITATDIGDCIAQGGPDLDAVMLGQAPTGARFFAALVWITRRRNSSKGIALRMISDTVSFDNIDASGDEKEPAEKPTDPSPDAND